MADIMAKIMALKKPQQSEPKTDDGGLAGMDINLDIVDDGPPSSEEADTNKESVMQFDSIQLEDQ